MINELSTSRSIKTSGNNRKLALLLLVTLGCLGFVAAKYWEPSRNWFTSIRSRPAVGTDFELMKIVYYDLYNTNSKKYHLAGEPEFPIDTDTLRFVSASDIKALQAVVREEMLNSIAYGANKKQEPSRRIEAVIPTNTFQQLVNVKGLARIVSLKVQSTDATALTKVRVQMMASRDKEEETSGQTAKGGSNQAQKVHKLFRQFLSTKSNGYNPLGKNADLTYDQLSNVYGYGQCDDQSHALADLFHENGIDSRILSLQNPSHSLIEASLGEDRWVAFDPYLSTAFMNPDTGEELSFAQVLSNPTRALNQYCPDDSLRTDALKFYTGQLSKIKNYSAYRSLDRSFDLQPNEQAQYVFNEMYPWITLRNVALPPDGVVGFLKRTIVLKPEITASPESVRSTSIKMPFPIVDAEVDFLADGVKPELYVGSVGRQKVVYDHDYHLTRLRRYIERNPLSREADGVLRFQDTIDLALNYSNQPRSDTGDVKLTVISELSSLPYYVLSDGFIKIVADENTRVTVTIEYVDR